MQFDFLICSERSGSNLMTKMLDAHAEVCGPFPSQIIKTMGPQIFRYGDLQRDENWKTLLQDTVDYLHAMHSEWRVYPTRKELAEHVPERNFGAVVRYAYEKEAKEAAKQRLFVKDNHAYSSIGFIEAHFDNPRYVWLVRDPRDMAYTWKNSVLNGGLDNSASTWQRDQSASMQVYGYMKALGRIVLVRFEDLLSQPERELRRVCETLELEYTPQMLEFHKSDVVQKNAGQMTAWNDLGSPLKQDNFDLYQDGLSEVEVRYVEAVCGGEMDFFGYELEYEPGESADELFEQLPGGVVSVNDPGHEQERAIFQRWSEVRQRIAQRKLY